MDELTTEEKVELRLLLRELRKLIPHRLDAADLYQRTTNAMYVLELAE